METGTKPESKQTDASPCTPVVASITQILRPREVGGCDPKDKDYRNFNELNLTHLVSIPTKRHWEITTEAARS